MRHSIFSFLGVRQHFFSDQIYQICIYSDSIEMTAVGAQRPKYVLPLNLQTCLEIRGQVQKGQRALNGFVFSHKREAKLVVADSEDLISFMDIVGNKVTLLQITNFYTAIEIIGRGSSSSVSVVVEKFTEAKFAVKSIDKSYLKNNDKYQILFQNEVLILQKLAEHNEERIFPQLYRIFESSTSHYLVLNLMKGKSLADYHQKFKKKTNQKLIPKDQIRLIMQRLLTGVAQLHQLRIIHRDLKPDNLLLDEANNLDSLVIADFGLASFLDVEKYNYPICGTQGFMAPEVEAYKEKYDEKIDIFSCGVIFFWLYGYIYNSLTGDVRINLENPYLKSYDPSTLDLLFSLIEQNPRLRISAQSALSHPFLSQEELTKKTVQTTLYGNENVSQMDEPDALNVYVTPEFKKPNMIQQQKPSTRPDSPQKRLLP